MLRVWHICTNCLGIVRRRGFRRIMIGGKVVVRLKFDFFGRPPIVKRIGSKVFLHLSGISMLGNLPDADIIKVRDTADREERADGFGEEDNSFEYPNNKNQSNIMKMWYDQICIAYTPLNQS